MADDKVVDIKPKDQVPAPVEEPAQAPTLSPHIVHAQAHFGKAQVESRGYELGIAVLEAELRGITEHVNGEITRIEAETAEEIEEIQTRAKRRIARLKEDFVVDKANLDRRLADLKDTKSMIDAQIAAYRQLHPEPEKFDEAETDTQSADAGTGDEADHPDS